MGVFRQTLNAPPSWRCALIAASLVAAGFPPIGCWPLTWVGFVYFVFPLLSQNPRVATTDANLSVAKSTIRAKAKVLAIYFGSFAFFTTCLGFYWLAYTIKEFGEMPWVVAVPVCLLIFLLFSILSGLAGVAWSRLSGWLVAKSSSRDLPVREALALALLLMVWDTLDVRVFPWSPAMSVGVDKFILPSVYFLGTWGWRVLFFGVVTGAAFVLHLPRLPQKQKGVAILGLAAMVLGLGYGVGFWARQVLMAKYSARQPVVLLQGNVGNYEKKLSKLGVMPTVINVMNIHRALIEEVAIEKSNLIRKSPEFTDAELWVAWPETSFPGFPMERGALTEQLLDWTHLTGGVHFVGAYEKAETDFAGQRVNLDFNVTALFHASTGYVAHARKMLRIPLGEYIPFDEYFPFLYSWLPAVNHFGKGTEPTPLAHPDPNGPVFLPVVCYEILYANFVDRYIEAAQKLYPHRSLVIVNPTNDSWYGPTSEPFQHSLLARWSAVRHGLASMRATNTGLSQVIAPWGEVLNQGPQDESAAIFGLLPVEHLQKNWKGNP